jgi:hypothetical protein
VRRWRRNADPRLRDLERQLSASPNDVDLQHALMIAKVRAGELPPYAADRLIPGRPVQPWQWVPASYVLLEAEQLGRRTAWREGKVEIEWISVDQQMRLTHGDELVDTGIVFDAPEVYGPSASIPAFGFEGERAQQDGARKAPVIGEEEDPVYYDKTRYTKTYVGARETDWEHAQIIAGFDPQDPPAPLGSPDRNAYVLDVLPPRWIPGLTDVVGWEVRRDPFAIFYVDSDVSWGAEEPGLGGPKDYRGGYPDAHDPQMLLYASRRVTQRGTASSRWSHTPHVGVLRNLVKSGPLLDVRLIRRVRIMRPIPTKRGTRWK